MRKHEAEREVRRAFALLMLAEGTRVELKATQAYLAALEKLNEAEDDERWAI